jgi:hypothetical protein
MRIRVTNWQRWNRVKAVYVAVCCIISLAGIGGLDPEPYEPMPNPALAVVFAILAAAGMLSLIGTRER